MESRNIEIEIGEVPPSVNAMYRHSKFGVYMTPKGREFKEYVQLSLKNLVRAGKIAPYSDERLKVEYEFHFKGKRKRDTDNYIKSIQDCLEGILFDNDEQIEELTAKRFYHAEYNHTVIKAYELKEVA